MKELTAEELKQIQLNILKHVAEFCDVNGIKYFLCGGTLLGAIRHKGFIPWDDDIDIAMPRKDYVRFFELYDNTNGRYRADSLENNPDWHLSVGRVGDLNTVLYDHVLKEKYANYHAFIDIFPVDGVPNNSVKHKILLYCQKLLSTLANASSFSYSASNHFSDSKEVNINLKNNIRTCFKYILITLCFPFSTKKIQRLVNFIAQLTSISESNMVGLTTYVWNWKFEVLKKESIDKFVLVPFEDSEFYAPIGYDEYLSSTYGDYMTPPPKASQVSHHNFKVYWK
ncbi:MAG: LicD family protein [Veillonella caviae]|uniref:LicD family protein n=1 Tax=Veillonella caviae TaxID=248316 RepID=UPI0023F8ADFC|nr:LicD family protein [Veillonella caviae]MCI7694411.1 LicD family protein [Veillonella caviae]